ncbi:MAG TPA: hypothetical protein VF263_17275, partial [Longimicrobiaceae bacterium]
MRRALLSLVAGTLLLAPALLPAPEPSRPSSAAGWDDARALDLVRVAQERRSATLVDTALANYQADARGYVYFYLDRRDTGERTLVKTDQVALDVFWKAPASAKQRIVGLRDRKTLPTNINYHLDHLAVVQDNFGDRIRLGDGDEVRDVLHPAAPGAGSFYQYRVADSLSIRLPGSPEPVRVYEVEVRPRDLRQPAFLGSVFVDQRRGDLVRMDFTFTPASYVDRNLDYINISLDNGLWKERFWLPNQQRVEIRRQIPELDFPAGGVIRGTMKVSNYRFNQDLPDALFAGPRVVAVPQAQRERFAFEQEIHEEVREEGISPEVELAEVRRQAAALARERVLSGLPGTRLDVGTASGVLRYNRAEGLAVGVGVSSRLSETLAGRLRLGYAFGPGHANAEAGLRTQVDGTGIEVGAFANAPRDVGVGPAASGALNTLASLLAGEDYTEPFYATGAEARVERPLVPGWRVSAEARGERHRSATLASDFSVLGGTDAFRPVRPVDEGDLFGVAFGVRRAVPSEVAAGWGAGLRLEGATMDLEEGGALTFFRPMADARWVRSWTPRDALLELDAAAGAAWGDLPRQALFLVGGRGTVPGFAFRAFGGDRFATARATGSAELLAPWVRGRVFGAAGWTGGG